MAIDQAQQFYPAGTRVLVYQVGFKEYECMGTVLKLTKRNLPLPSPDWSIVRLDDGGVGCYHKSWLHPEEAETHQQLGGAHG